MVSPMQQSYLLRIDASCPGGVPHSSATYHLSHPFARPPCRTLEDHHPPSLLVLSLSRLPLLIVLSFVFIVPLLAVGLHAGSLLPALGLPHTCISWVFRNNPQCSSIPDLLQDY